MGVLFWWFTFLLSQSELTKQKVTNYLTNKIEIKIAFRAFSSVFPLNNQLTGVCVHE